MHELKSPKVTALAEIASIDNIKSYNENFMKNNKIYKITNRLDFYNINNIKNIRHKQNYGLIQISYFFLNFNLFRLVSSTCPITN